MIMMEEEGGGGAARHQKKNAVKLSAVGDNKMDGATKPSKYRHHTSLIICTIDLQRVKTSLC